MHRKRLHNVPQHQTNRADAQREPETRLAALHRAHVSVAFFAASTVGAPLGLSARSNIC